jgi:hypothetical protein
MDPIVIAHRFRGPFDSGNGGYSCGVVGARIGGEAEVTLRAKPPLDVSMEVEQKSDGSIAMRHGDLLVAEGRPAKLELEVPEPVDFERAALAEKDYVYLAHHPYAECFVCGTKRPHGDGLAIYPGPIAERRIVASTWLPDPTLGEIGSDNVRPEFVWSALDCPSWHGVNSFHGGAFFGLLGRLTAKIESVPKVGERCVVIGWEIGLEKRKLFGGSAVFGEDGRRIGAARATWILDK